MQSLILDRSTRKISPFEFATTATESFYTILAQNAGTDVFPVNCHQSVGVNALALEKQNYQFLISGSADSSIKLWDLKEQEDKSIDKHLSFINSGDIDNPVSTYLNIATVPRRSAHKFGISSVQWWPFDTGMFVTSSFDHTVKAWDTNEMTPVHTFDLESRVYSIDVRGYENNSMSADALIAVAGDHQFLRLLDLRSTSSAHTLSGHRGKILAVKWHPTQPNLLASSGFDGEVKVWDIRRSKSCLARLDMLRTNPQQMITDNLTRPSVKAHLGPVNGLAWDESGCTLYTTGNDDKIRVWDMVSSLSPPLNKLVNFGPYTRNKYTQSIPFVLNPKCESELQYLLFPSDNSDILVFRTVDGKLVSRLTRKGSKNVGRTTSMVNLRPFLGTYLCGTIDGEILSWSPKFKRPDHEDVFDYTSDDLVPNSKQNLLSRAIEEKANAWLEEHL